MGPEKDLVLRLRRRERPELALAREERGARVQRLVVEPPRPPERAARQERRPLAPVEDDVAVAAPRRAESRVEPRGGLVRTDDADVVRQHGVERLREPAEGWAAVRLDARDLAGCMHAGDVGALTRDGEAVPAREDGVERVAKRGLDRPRPRLPGPAPEGRPVSN